MDRGIRALLASRNPANLFGAYVCLSKNSPLQYATERSGLLALILKKYLTCIPNATPAEISMLERQFERRNYECKDINQFSFSKALLTKWISNRDFAKIESFILEPAALSDWNYHAKDTAIRIGESIIDRLLIAGEVALIARIISRSLDHYANRYSNRKEIARRGLYFLNCLAQQGEFTVAAKILEAAFATRVHTRSGEKTLMNRSFDLLEETVKKGELQVAQMILKTTFAQCSHLCSQSLFASQVLARIRSSVAGNRVEVADWLLCECFRLFPTGTKMQNLIVNEALSIASAHARKESTRQIGWLLEMVYIYRSQKRHSLDKLGHLVIRIIKRLSQFYDFDTSFSLIDTALYYHSRDSHAFRLLHKQRELLKQSAASCALGAITETNNLKRFLTALEIKPKEISHFID